MIEHGKLKPFSFNSLAKRRLTVAATSKAITVTTTAATRSPTLYMWNHSRHRANRASFTWPRQDGPRCTGSGPIQRRLASFALESNGVFVHRRLPALVSRARDINDCQTRCKLVVRPRVAFAGFRGVSLLMAGHPFQTQALGTC